jgi:hypothetical protein
VIGTVQRTQVAVLRNGGFAPSYGALVSSSSPAETGHSLRSVPVPHCAGWGRGKAALKLGVNMQEPRVASLIVFSR